MKSDKKKKIAILGTVGVPGNYGGFETLAENLARYHAKSVKSYDLVIYCSRFSYAVKPRKFLNASLRYLPIRANGIQSILYDSYSLLESVILGSNAVIVLGVSGAIFLPFVRIFSNVKIITNIDGIEWKRTKWGSLARTFLKYSEGIAVKYSHLVVADNDVIKEYILKEYDRASHLIAYGGNHALEVESDQTYCNVNMERFAIAICRIEPENNVELILESFSRLPDTMLVFIGNWKANSYGLSLFEKYSRFPNLVLMLSLYDIRKLKYLRERAFVYIHGHSAGGTNPALVEMMYFEIPIIAFDCSYNRSTTDNLALYFSTSEDLRLALIGLTSERSKIIGKRMKDIAVERYNWNDIASEYFRIIDKLFTPI